MLQAFDIDSSSCLRVSAKTGMGLEQVATAIIERIPPPGGDSSGKLRMLLFDAVHDEYRWTFSGLSPSCIPEHNYRSRLGSYHLNGESSTDAIFAKMQWYTHTEENASQVLQVSQPTA